MSFKSWRSFVRFKHVVGNDFRYIFDQESKDFLQAIENTCKSRMEIIPINSLMWRAQAGYDERPLFQDDIHIDNLPVPYSEKRMRPLQNSASEGRANPKGIPCLYIASDKETAMSEIRPWLGSLVSVARFVSERELKIINFSKHYGKTNKIYLKEPTESEKIEAVWHDLDNAFSQPVTHSDIKSDYAPTQIVAELIKSLGYDGIAFKSSLSNGHNLAIFDLNSLEFAGCELHEVNKVDFCFKNVKNQFNP